MRANDVLNMNHDHVLRGDVLTIKELPIAIVIVDDMHDRSTLEGNPALRV